jgi:uncharacterized repeat protein (TIGR03803 family)
VRANRVRVRSSKSNISLISNRLCRELGTSLLGTIAAGAIVLTCQNSVQAQLTIFHSFGDGTVANDGAHPEAGLIQAPSGNFFGVTNAQAAAPSTTAGTVFQMTRKGKVTVIQSFGNGAAPLEPLLYYKGRLIGVTAASETNNGTLFALKRLATGGWKLNDWYQFGGTNGPAYPAGNIILGSDGFLYGTSGLGGPNFGGTVYKLDPTTHQVTVVLGFATAYGAWNPANGLVQGNDGNFYGATQRVAGFQYGIEGAIFQLTPGGQGTPELFEQLQATGPFIQASNGTFYGIGGTFSNDYIQSSGLVFSFTTAGAISILHTFGQGNDGAYPAGTVVQAPNGDLYGITSLGGTTGNGILFEISTDGTSYTILHNFGDGSVTNDGLNPFGTLIVGQDGNLYGTTLNGGSAGLGTVFEFSLAP